MDNEKKKKYLNQYRGSVRNFHQREYDYGSLEAQLLGGRDERVEEGNGD